MPPTTVPTTPLAELLVRLRKGAGLSQADLARTSGLSVRAIRDLEVGVTAKPRQWSLRAVADALGLTADERALLTAAAVPGLPRPDAPPALAAGDLVGRTADLRALLDLVRAGVHRLISVTGPGGVGKSRLATEAAGVLARQAGLDVYTVDLSGVAGADRVGDVLAEALGVGGRSRLDPVSRIAAQYRTRRFVVVLDGFERLLPAASMIRALVARCTGLTVVATSRVPLRTGDERELRLEPLALPGVSDEPAELLAAPAMRLLVGRAAASRPGFALTEANAADLAAICRAVEGLPLAIELAAAWLRLLAPAELVARFDRKLELLTDGPRGMPERHRSLRATIEYSLDIVGTEARTLFAWLAPFPGGVLLADLEQVTAALGQDREWLLTGLGDLVDASLVRPRAEGQRTRYVLPDTMRELAGERLASSTVDSVAVERVVAGHYLGRLRAAAAHRAGDGFAPLDPDVDNLRAALAWATTDGQDLLDLDVVDATARYCETRGRFAEGRASLFAVAQALRVASPARASRALMWSGYLTRFLHDFAEAERRVRDGIALLPPDDHVGASVGNLLLGNLASDQGDLPGAMAHTSRALEAARRSGDRKAIGKALNNLAAAMAGSGDLDRAESLLLEALADKRSSGAHPVEIGRSLMNLAEVAQAAARWESARSYAAEAATVLRAGGHPRLYANALSLVALGHLNSTPPDLAAAGAAMDRAASLLPDFGDDRTLRGLLQIRRSVVLAARGADGADQELSAGAAALLNSEAVAELALVAEYHAALCAEHHPEPAAVLLGVAEAIRAVPQAPQEPAGRAAAARATNVCRKLLGAKRFADVRDRGVRTSRADIPATMAGALRAA